MAVEWLGELSRCYTRVARSDGEHELLNVLLSIQYIYIYIC